MAGHILAARTPTLRLLRLQVLDYTAEVGYLREVSFQGSVLFDTEAWR